MVLGDDLLEFEGGGKQGDGDLVVLGDDWLEFEGAVQGPQDKSMG